jgi:hypothetical protein
MDAKQLITKTYVAPQMRYGIECPILTRQLRIIREDQTIKEPQLQCTKRLTRQLCANRPEHPSKRLVWRNF